MNDYQADQAAEPMLTLGRNRKTFLLGVALAASLLAQGLTIYLVYDVVTGYIAG